MRRSRQRYPLSSITAGIANMIMNETTIDDQTKSGMSLNRIPLFVWSSIVVSFMIMFAMPAVMLDSGYLCLDRLIATHFFNQSEGEIGRASCREIEYMTVVA